MTVLLLLIADHFIPRFQLACVGVTFNRLFFLYFVILGVCSLPPTTLNSVCQNFSFPLLYPCFLGSTISCISDRIMLPSSPFPSESSSLFRIQLLLVSSRFKDPTHHFILYKYCQKSPQLFLCDNWSLKNILSFPMLRS